MVVIKEKLPCETPPPDAFVPKLPPQQENEKVSDFSKLPQPRWIKYDKKVLTFGAYFKEPVYESPDEPYRVRRLVISYFLEDHTSLISEPRVENSGLPQGPFVKRHQIPNEKTGKPFYFTDFGIGQEISVYGRTMRVFEIDDFTRHFLTDQGISVSENESCPEDPFIVNRNKSKHTRKTLGPPHPRDNDLMRSCEAALGRAAHLMGPDNYRQFLENDGKVLRFYAVWDDRNALYGEVRKFSLHYFLADDTIELSEIHDPNSGRGNFATLLKRSKLPRTSSIDMSITQLDDPRDRGQYVKDSDLKIGKYINVLGRDILIVAGDPFTVEYMTKTHGYDMTPMTLPDPKPKAPRMEIPPPTGYGTEEDSLQSFYRLVPKPIHKDMRKYMDNARTILRFEAQFKDRSPEDEIRRFIIAYFLADDTVSIFEPPIRNSGIIGGKFLERKRVMNLESGDWFKASDLYIGGVFKFYQRAFEIIGADDFTLNYMEYHAQDFAQSHPDRILHLIRNASDESVFHQLQDALVALDPDQSSLVATTAFHTTLQSIYPRLTLHEAICVGRQFLSDHQVNYMAFLKALTGP